MVSEELHFTRVAEKLGISQPTLSHQIKVLEQEVGHPLFYRIGPFVGVKNRGRPLSGGLPHPKNKTSKRHQYISGTTKAIHPH